MNFNNPSISKLVLFGLGLGVLSVSLFSKADVASQQSSVMQVEEEAEAAKTFNFAASAEYSQKSTVNEKSPRESAIDYALILGYKINEKFLVGAKASLSKENTGAENTTLSDTLITLAIQGVKFSESLESVHAVVGVVPTSDDSKKRDRLQGALATTNGIRYTIPAAIIEYRIGLSKNFHEYDFNAEGKANVSYGINNSLDIKLPLTEKFMISALGKYKLGYTYGNFQRNNFEIHADLNYDFTPHFGVNLGTSNVAKALKADGTESNIALYSDETSVLRAGLNYTY